MLLHSIGPAPSIKKFLGKSTYFASIFDDMDLAVEIAFWQAQCQIFGEIEGESKTFLPRVQFL